MSNQTMLLRQHHQLSGIRGVNQPLSRRRQPPDAVDSTVAVLFQFANHGQPVARLVLLVDLEDARHYPSVTGYYAAGQTDNEVATEGRQRNRNRVLFEWCRVEALAERFPLQAVDSCKKTVNLVTIWQLSTFKESNFKTHDKSCQKELINLKKRTNDVICQLQLSQLYKTEETVKIIGRR